MPIEVSTRMSFEEKKKKGKQKNFLFSQIKCADACPRKDNERVMSIYISIKKENHDIPASFTYSFFFPQGKKPAQTSV
jgi:hypothetical protein